MTIRPDRAKDLISRARSPEVTVGDLVLICTKLRQLNHKKEMEEVRRILEKKIDSMLDSARSDNVTLERLEYIYDQLKPKVILYKVAKEFNLSHDTLIAFLSKHGYVINNHMSIIDDQMYSLINRHFSEEKIKAIRHNKKRGQSSHQDRTEEEQCSAVSPAWEEIELIFKRKVNALLKTARSSNTTITDLERICDELRQRRHHIARQALSEVNGIMANIIKNQEGYFLWPSTDAPASKIGYTGIHYEYKEGLLTYVGYHVGISGVAEPMRRKILDCVFYLLLPKVVSDAYMDEWGDPNTPARLKKTAECIAAFIRNAKRNTWGDYDNAINDWESDLKYLYDQYYVGNFHFDWPRY